MTAFTPPPESWIIRYPNQQKQQQQQQQQSQNQSSSKKEEKKIKTSSSASSLVPGANQLEAACKNYIESADIPVKSNKSLGTDDHFKSMVCSKNLLKVCEKLMTNKANIGNSNNSIDSSYDNDDEFDAELSLMNEKSRMEYYRNKHGNHRNSLSLPSSPKMERKNNAPVAYNPYFTISKPPEARAETGSISFLTNLFGITARKPGNSEMQSTSSQFAQKTDTNNKSTFSSSDSSYKQQQPKQSQEEKPKTKMIPQPHEYREMNFWSPTSM